MNRLVFGAICLAAASASAENRITFPQQGDSINEDTSPVVTNGFGRPRLDRVWVDLEPAAFAAPAVNSNKIYLNNCKPNGCVIRSGNASSLDGSGYQGTWGINGQKTLAAFNQSDAVWNNVVTCMKDVFSRFGVEITTTNPSPSPHFEVMIAGSPTNIGLSNGIGGISPFGCGGPGYIPNSLVFAFANISIYQNDPEEICATAAQEIAHSFQLDHVTDPSDPLTYFNYNGRRQFKDAQVTCGSDCVGGQSPFGMTCTGSNQQTHGCYCGGATQNSVQSIRNLFGSGTPTPPTIKITSPTLGESVAPGFPIRVEATDDNGIGNVTGTIDGVANLAPMAIVTAPYAFNAPATLANGTHTIRMVATDIYGTQAEASVQVIIGEPCSKPADCPNDTDTCIGGRCVTGPGVQGGLGSTCNTGIDCASGQCAQDSTGAKHCVEPCVIDEGQCPDGFGCLPTGDTGVCWPGYDDGSGGCSAAGPGGQITLGLAFASLLFARRRRRSRA